MPMRRTRLGYPLNQSIKQSINAINLHVHVPLLLPPALLIPPIQPVARVLSRSISHQH